MSFLLQQTRIKRVSIERGPLYFYLIRQLDEYSGSAEVLFKNRLLKLGVQGQPKFLTLTAFIEKKKRDENEEKQKDKQISAPRSKADRN